jgi:hypothetical protein
VTLKVTVSPWPRTMLPSSTSPPMRNTSLGDGGSAITWLGRAEEVDAVAHGIAHQRRGTGERHEGHER